jgi:hypothetical protein
MNPVKLGPLASWPSWPWAYGTAVEPKGSQCGLCPIVLRIGFEGEYKTLEQVLATMRTDQTLSDEWLTCLDIVIEKKNKGELTMKIRGKVKDGIVTALIVVRKSVVELIHKNGIRIREKFKAVTLERWALLYPNDTDPKAAGFQTKKVMYRGALTDVVLIRVLPEGEFDLEFESEVAAEHREEHDNSDDHVWALGVVFGACSFQVRSSLDTSLCAGRRHKSVAHVGIPSPRNMPFT